MMPLGPHTIWFVGPKPTDAFGDPIPGADPVEFKVTGCMIYPRGSAEGDARSPNVVTGSTVLVPKTPERIAAELDIEVDALSTVKVRSRHGGVADIEGQPGPWYNLDGTHAATQVATTKAVSP